MSKELEALSYLVETSIYGNKENNRGKIFDSEKEIKQALQDYEELKEEREIHKQSEDVSKQYVEQQEKELEELKENVDIYLSLETKINKVGLAGLNEIEYSNYHKSYKNLKKLVGDPQ